MGRPLPGFHGEVDLDLLAALEAEAWVRGCVIG